MPLEIAKGIYWVGVVDWDLRRFHGHELSTHRGSTYNSYLIVDEKIALVDTVWSPFTEQLLDNIAQVVDPSKIDYVIANHAEVDHSGALPEVMRRAPHATLIVSKRGAESVPGHYHEQWNMKAVASGAKIGLGRCELLFIEASMLHWPDSMFTYVAGKDVLMPNDAFGQHYATAFRFNDQVDRHELYEECLKYYVNILTPFSPQVIKKIDEFIGLKLPVEIIAPSHGVIWRKDPLQIVHQYREWAAQIPEAGAVIIYDTMWNATRRMAECIGAGLAEAGMRHKLFHVAAADRNDLLVELFKARTILIGSSTHNNSILSTLLPVLQDMEGLKFKNKLGGAFGSYGWSGEAVKIIEDFLKGMQFEMPVASIKCKWQPDSTVLQACRKFGRQVAQAMLPGA
jgi:anaerobic nitric oxide reductase flavorubredoxin